MRGDLSASVVAARLEALRILYTPLSEHEARALLEPPSVVDRVPGAREVSQRLAELRALCELTRYLHRGRRLPLGGTPTETGPNRR